MRPSHDNRIYGVSLWYFFADLLAFLWVIHLKVEYNNNIFSAMELTSVVVNSLHTREAHFPAIFHTLYYYYSMVHVVSFLQHFELARPSNSKINRWVSCWGAHERRCFTRRSQRSSPRNGVNGLFVWVILGVKFRDVIRERYYWHKLHLQTTFAKAAYADAIGVDNYLTTSYYWLCAGSLFERNWTTREQNSSILIISVNKKSKWRIASLPSNRKSVIFPLRISLGSCSKNNATSQHVPPYFLTKRI